MRLAVELLGEAGADTACTLIELDPGGRVLLDCCLEGEPSMQMPASWAPPQAVVDLDLTRVHAIVISRPQGLLGLPILPQNKCLRDVSAREVGRKQRRSAGGVAGAESDIGGAVPVYATEPVVQQASGMLAEMVEVANSMLAAAEAGEELPGEQQEPGGAALGHCSGDELQLICKLQQLAGLEEGWMDSVVTTVSYGQQLTAADGRICLTPLPSGSGVGEAVWKLQSALHSASVLCVACAGLAASLCAPLRPESLQGCDVVVLAAAAAGGTDGSAGGAGKQQQGRGRSRTKAAARFRSRMASALRPCLEAAGCGIIPVAPTSHGVLVAETVSELLRSGQLPPASLHYISPAAAAAIAHASVAMEFMAPERQQRVLQGLSPLLLECGLTHPQPARGGPGGAAQAAVQQLHLWPCLAAGLQGQPPDALWQRPCVTLVPACSWATGPLRDLVRSSDAASADCLLLTGSSRTTCSPALRCLLHGSRIPLFHNELPERVTAGELTRLLEDLAPRLVLAPPGVLARPAGAAAAPCPRPARAASAGRDRPASGPRPSSAGSFPMLEYGSGADRTCLDLRRDLRPEAAWAPATLSSGLAASLTVQPAPCPYPGGSPAARGGWLLGPCHCRMLLRDGALLLHEPEAAAAEAGMPAQHQTPAVVWGSVDAQQLLDAARASHLSACVVSPRALPSFLHPAGGGRVLAGVRFAGACGAVWLTEHGAIVDAPSAPGRQQIADLILSCLHRL